MNDQCSSAASATVTRTWLPRGYTVLFRCHCPLKPGALSEIADGALGALDGLVQHNTLENYKGIDRGFLLELFPEAESTMEQELSFIRAQIPPIEEGDTRESIPAFLRSSFLDFQGAHHIRHTTSSSLPHVVQDLSFRDLTRAVPLHLEEFRFGIDRFESRRYFGMLGFAPQVTRTLAFRARPHELEFVAFSEGLRQKDLPVFEEDSLWKSLADLVSFHSDDNVRDLYRRTLANAS